MPRGGVNVANMRDTAGLPNGPPMSPKRPPRGIPPLRKKRRKKFALFVCLVESGAGKRHILFLYREGKPTPKVGVAPIGEVPEEIWS